MEVTTTEIIDKIHDMVMSDRRIKVRKIGCEENLGKMGAAFALRGE